MLRSNDAGNYSEFRATYKIESSELIQKVAEVIAGKQSSGTFLFLPGETDGQCAGSGRRGRREN